MYFIIRGFLGIFSRDSEDSCLAKFSHGQTLGENALLAGEESVRAITAKCLTKCELLRLTRASFDTFRQSQPNAFISLILHTTSRQWRVASFVMSDILGLTKV